MTELEVGPFRARVEEGEWSGDDEVVRFARLLELPLGYYPDRDRALALRAAELLGGRVTTPEPRPEPRNEVF